MDQLRIASWIHNMGDQRESAKYTSCRYANREVLQQAKNVKGDYTVCNEGLTIYQDHHALAL